MSQSPTHAMSTAKMATTGFSVANASTIPDFLSTRTLSTKRYLLASTGNTHGVKAQEYLSNLYPLPKMFGQEGYAFSLIDIEDPRYVAECAAMSARLIRLFNDQQIMDITWKKYYADLTDAEHKLAALPASASMKARDEYKESVKTRKARLLELQVQKDKYATEVQKIFDRCQEIKTSIKKENDLDQLAEEMTVATRQKYRQDDPFWSKSFNVSVEHDDEDDPLAHINLDETM